MNAFPKIRILLLIAIGHALLSCANSLNHEEKTEDLSYQYTETYGGSTCTTTKIQYVSAEDLCGKLKNSQLNHNCAERMRYDQFQKVCPNQHWN
jgi:hypothetical protein